MEITFLYDWFHCYSQSFYSVDPEIMRGIRLKEDHSLRVAVNALAIANYLGQTDRDLTLAETAGLLHDTARHTQWTQFRSFNDAITQYDHGTEGASIIADAGILDSQFTLAEQDAILFSIIHHNKLGVPANSPEKVRLANIIRDADKLDIFRTLPAVTTIDQDYSAALLPLLLDQRPLPYAQAKKPADRRLLRLGWLYDINFDWTLRQIVAEGYADGLLSGLPDGEPFTAIKSGFRQYLAARCS